MLLANKNASASLGTIHNATIKSYKKTISIKSICWFLMALQLLVANIAKHSVFYQVAASVFILACFFYLFFQNSVRISKYHIITFLFIFYNILLVILGVAIDVIQPINMIKTISFNFIISIFIYSLLVKVNDPDKLLKTYVNMSLISNIIILFVYKDSLSSGRLAFSWKSSVDSYNIFGIELITAGSNGIAYYSAIAFILSTYLYLRKGRKKRYLVFDLLFIFTVLFTGSRKGLMVLLFGFIILMNILNKGNKKVVYISISLILCILLYFLIQSVPILYEIIGVRTEELINLILGKSVEDSSINTRLRLIDMAFELFKERPFFGYGLDAFRVICPWGIISDNNFLEILVSSGIIGFIIYYSYVLFVLHDYVSIKNKSEACKILFWIFILTLVIEVGSVTYFERNFMFINMMLYYILRKEIKEERYVKAKQES